MRQGHCPHLGALWRPCGVTPEWTWSPPSGSLWGHFIHMDVSTHCPPSGRPCSVTGSRILTEKRLWSCSDLMHICQSGWVIRAGEEEGGAWGSP